MGHEHEHPHQDHHRHLKVRVVTTAGTFPGHGYQEEPIIQHIEVVLRRAATDLRLVDTSAWIVRCNGVDIHPHRSYQDSGLKGHVDLDWGPPERGGGNHA